MKSFKYVSVTLLIAAILLAYGCSREPSAGTAGASPASAKASAPAAPDAIHSLRGSSGYTPYDWCSLRWAQTGGEMVWVNSGADAVRLLVSKADPSRRPDWIFCSQGAVAGQAARGERLVVLATLYVSADAVRPVFRKPRTPLAGARSLFIPRSSIEVAFDRLLLREGIAANDIKLPRVESPSFNTIVALLTKPVTDADAIDFGVLVEPFISNLVNSQPGAFEIGAGGIYELSYCLVAREEDVRNRRADYVSLLQKFARISEQVEAWSSDDQFYTETWGRKRDETPERLPRLVTFDRAPARLQLDASKVRRLIREEISHLVMKYPADLRLPDNIDTLIDESLLREAASSRVTP